MSDDTGWLKVVLFWGVIAGLVWLGFTIFGGDAQPSNPIKQIDQQYEAMHRLCWGDNPQLATAYIEFGDASYQVCMDRLRRDTGFVDYR